MNKKKKKRKRKPEEKPSELSGARPEKRVPMTRIRARIAERLLEAQQNTAMLTTFNEVNMQPVMEFVHVIEINLKKHIMSV